MPTDIPTDSSSHTPAHRNTRLPAQAERLAHWLQQKAIPLWITRGINPDNGVHYERLLADGTADRTSDIRLRVQARQAFFFAAAAEHGWCVEGGEIARRMLGFVQQHGLNHSTGGYGRLFNRHYQLVDTYQDLYDHAFVLLASAWIYRVTGDKQVIANAERLVRHLDNRFGSLHGGWIEGIDDQGNRGTPYRRQNPHMHLLEAFLSLFDATGSAHWLARAGEIVGLFQTRYFDAEKGVLFEFFERDWSQRIDAHGEIVEPGHMMEWVWLLDWYGQRTQKPLQHITQILYQNGLALGRHPSGLLYDAVSPSGTVLDPSKRCWVVTELIKASLVQIRHGNQDAEAIAIEAVDNLFKFYLSTDTEGSYFEHLGADNQVTVDIAPATTLYHIMMAAIELHHHCARLPAQPTKQSLLASE